MCIGINTIGHTSVFLLLKDLNGEFSVVYNQKASKKRHIMFSNGARKTLNIKTRDLYTFILCLTYKKRHFTIL